MRSRVAGTILATLLVTGVGSTQQPDTIRTAGAPISVQPIAHGTVALLLGRHVVLIDPARFVPGHPEPPREDLQEMAKAYIARFGAPPKPPASSDEEPNPDLLVSALPIRPEQIARFRRISPTVILVTHTHTDHLDPPAIAAVRTPQTRIVVPTATKGMLLDVQGAETMANGERITIEDLTIDAVPMYNPKPELQHGTIFHPKGRGNGYIVSLSRTRVYIRRRHGLHAGDASVVGRGGRVRADEPAVHHVTGRCSRVRESHEAADCLPVPLLRFGPEGLRGRVGRHRH